MYVGLQKTTLVNFPRRVAAAVFLPGCNMRCPYCHNAELALASPHFIPVKNTVSENTYCNIKAVYSFLQKRKHLISALVISGGEPFMSPLLFELIHKAKELSMAVKIDTNGLFPERLSQVLHSDSLKPDMIALDIKTALERYGELLPNMSEKAVEASKNALYQSISMLKNSTIEIEYRTVLVPPLVSKKEITGIAALLPKNAVWKLAQFVPGSCLNPEWNALKPYTVQEAQELLKTAKTIIYDTEIR